MPRVKRSTADLSFSRRVMKKAMDIFIEKELTLERVGIYMGYEKRNARSAAHQLLTKIQDPRISTIKRLAQGLGVSVSELVNV